MNLGATVNAGKNRVLLLYPTAEEQLWIFMPLPLLYVAQPLLEEGIEVEVIDQRFETDFFNRLRQRIGPDLICIGISCITGPHIEQVVRICEFIKRTTHTPVVLGGSHPTLLPEQTLESRFIDYVVVGNGEVPFLNLVRALKANAPLHDLTNVGYREQGRVVLRKNAVPGITARAIPYQLVARYGRPKTVSVITSQGCPYHCTFCVERVLHPIYYQMPLDDVLVMLEGALRLRPEVINFFDDNFLVNKRRVVELFSRCRQRGLEFRWVCTGRVDAVLSMDDDVLRFLRQAGLISVFFGIESGSSKILKLINKGITPETALKLNVRLRQEGITPHYSFMAGFPTETEEDVQKTMKLMHRLKWENPQAVIWRLNQYTPYPGTELFDLAVQHGFKPPERFEDWSRVHCYSKAYAAPYSQQL